MLTPPPCSSMDDHLDCSVAAALDDTIPDARWGHCAVSIAGKLYIWAGCTRSLPATCSAPLKTELMKRVAVLDMASNLWSHRITNGPCPPGVYGSAFTSDGENRIFHFGGYCGHEQCWHNCLHQLDVDSFQWKVLINKTGDSGPKQKQDCGMVFHNNSLCVVGGSAMVEEEVQPAWYHLIQTKRRTQWYTDELHLFSLDTSKDSLEFI